MINVITSKDNLKVKRAFSLKEKKYRDQYQEFLGESIKSLELALKAGLVKEIFTYEYIKDIDENIPQYLVDEVVMKKLSSCSNPEGVIFVAKMPKYENKNYQRILYLDHINDPGNMGTLIRSALAFNFDAVIVSKESVSIYNEKVLASSKGGNYLIPVFEDELKNHIKDKEVIVSALNKEAISLQDLKVKSPFILVVGNEAHGVSKEVMNYATIVTKIDISNIDSLNAATAGSILMYHLSLQK